MSGTSSADRLCAAGLSWGAAMEVVAIIEQLAPIVLTQPGAGSALPTSSVGLTTGSLWNNGGVLCIA